MIITGNNFYTKEFYHQSGASIYFETDSVKDFNFRILTNSGGSYYQDILFSSGKIFAGNNMTTGGYNYVGGYQSGESLSFEIRYNTGRYSFFLNDSIKFANKQILNSSTFQPYSEKPTLTGFIVSGRTSDNTSANIQVYGSQPGVYFSTLYPYNYPSQTGLYSGDIIISGLPGELYSFSLNNGYQYYIPNSKFSSGGYLISGLNFGSGATINADFNFDFGIINTNLSVYQSGIEVTGGFLNVSNSNSVLSGLPDPVQFQDYTVTNLINRTGNFESYLEFLYRSGNMIITGTGSMTGVMTGYISGSGYLYGSGTGYTTNGYYSQRGSIVNISPFNYAYTGDMTRQFTYGTGQIVYFYMVPATGLQQTNGLIDDWTTGWLSGYLTGVVNDGSGHYRFTKTISGIPEYWSGTYTGHLDFQREYGPIYFPDNPNSAYNPTYSGQNYQYTLDVTVLWTGNISRSVSQPFTGEFNSGIYDTGSGYITGFNLLTGDPAVLTGGFSYVYDNYYNYREEGHVSGRFLRKPPVSCGPGIYEYGIRVTHDRNLPNGVNDYYRIIFTDGYSSYSAENSNYYL